MHNAAAGIHHGYGEVTMSNSRRAANDMYANMRRPDVLMHGGHHAISDQDLLNLHNNSALPLDDNQVGSVPMAVAKKTTTTKIRGLAL